MPVCATVTSIERVRARFCTDDHRLDQRKTGGAPCRPCHPRCAATRDRRGDWTQRATLVTACPLARATPGRGAAARAGTARGMPHAGLADARVNLRLRNYIILSVQRRCPHKSIIERKLRIINIIIIHHPFSRTGTLIVRAHSSTSILGPKNLRIEWLQTFGSRECARNYRPTVLP